MALIAAPASIATAESTTPRTEGDAQVIPLWAGGAPGSEGQTAPEVITENGGVRRVSSIHNPSITLHLPPKEKATGAAVIILPGGGHKYLSIENEGNVFGKWLADRGIAGIVLKYRLAKDEGSPYKVDVHALADAQRAIRLVRARAAEWNIDPARIGILGFSAGGEVANLAASRFEAGNPQATDPVDRETSRPAFQALIYAGASKSAERPKDTPPTFICLAYDDKPKLKIAADELQKLRDAGVSTELHIYAKGGHGFGMRDRPLPITSWPFRFYDWLGDRLSI
jgi:endo-1,4-beta-xylanase